MYLCGPGKHNCQPFCGPEGRFYCSDSVCSLWPASFSYLCVSVRILCVCWKLSAAEQVKTDCWHTPAVVSTLLTPLPVSCPLTTPHHYIRHGCNTLSDSGEFEGEYIARNPQGRLAYRTGTISKILHLITLLLQCTWQPWNQGLNRWNAWKYQHTRELISARSKWQKYNNKDLSRLR